MADLSDTTFKWRCPKCDLLMEETDPSQLAIRKFQHEKYCKGLRSGRESKDDNSTTQAP